MKLLLDENLSFKLEHRLQSIFPNTRHVRSLAMETTQDINIWRYALEHEFVIVTQDSDFNDQALLNGFPPQVIWIRCGNSRLATVEELIRRHSVKIHAFINANAEAVLEISS